MENLKTRFNNLKYEHFKINFIGLDFEVKLLDNEAVFPNSKDNKKIEQFKVILTHKERIINFNFYNSIMEREISKNLKLNLEQYPKGILKIRDFRAYMKKQMWGGYDKVKNLKELTETRIYYLLYGIINSFAMDRTTETDNFKFFCDNFGYDEDSRKAEKIYKAVLEEYKNVKMLWTDEEIKKLAEIE